MYVLSLRKFLEFLNGSSPPTGGENTLESFHHHLKEYLLSKDRIVYPYALNL